MTYTVRQALDTDALGISAFLSTQSASQLSLKAVTVKQVAAKIAKAKASRYNLCLENGEIVGVSLFSTEASCVVEDEQRAAYLGIEVNTVIECDYAPMLIIKTGVSQRLYYKIAGLLILFGKEVRKHDFLWVRGARDCAGAGYMRKLEADEKPHGIKDGDWVVRWEHAFEIAERQVR